jgi:hypothetical protein
MKKAFRLITESLFCELQEGHKPKHWLVRLESLRCERSLFHAHPYLGGIVSAETLQVKIAACGELLGFHSL